MGGLSLAFTRLSQPPVLAHFLSEDLKSLWKLETNKVAINILSVVVTLSLPQLHVCTSVHLWLCKLIISYFLCFADVSTFLDGMLSFAQGFNFQAPELIAGRLNDVLRRLRSPGYEHSNNNCLCSSLSLRIGVYCTNIKALNGCISCQVVSSTLKTKTWSFP